MTQNRLRNLDLGTLRSFVTIADSGSMTRAASRLYMTQSAISMQIKRLESNLGFSVFDRSAQGMKTTVEGDQLLHFANRMLALNDEAMGRLTSPDYEGQIRFATPSDIAYPHIPYVLKEFSRDFPRVQIQYATASTYKLLDEYEQGMHDVVLTTEREPKKGGRIVLTRPLVWIGAEAGNAWKKRPLPIGFCKYCAFRQSVIDALDGAGIAWTDMTTANDEIAIEVLTSADLCVRAELDSERKSNWETISHGGQLPDLPEFSIALYSDDALKNPITRSLTDYIERAYS